MKEPHQSYVTNTVLTSFAFLYGTFSVLAFPGFLSQVAASTTPAPHRSSVAIVSPIKQDVWERFLDEKYTILTKEIVLRLPEEAASVQPEGWRIPLAEHAEWIIVKQTKTNIIASIDPLYLEQFLKEVVLPALPEPANAVITALPEGDNPHAVYEGIARDGWILRPDAVTVIIDAFERGILEMEIPLEFVRGTVSGTEGTGIGTLSLLARGHSNYGNSEANRIFNVKKAINEHIQGTFIRQGENYSFNDTLGGKVSTANGWKMALGIFRANGEEGAQNVEGTNLTLTLTPGGGICQTSTTAFRAIAAAGLPVVERFNHSMYITYYRDYGEGLDATIYPGSRNMVATNDTPGPIYFQAYTEGKDVYVEIYGTPDRTVTLEGPYRNHDNNEKVKELLKRNLGSQEIGWMQTITRDDGTVTQNIIKSNYQTQIPWKTAEKAGELPVVIRELPLETVSVVQEEESLHAAAPSPLKRTARTIRALLLQTIE